MTVLDIFDKSTLPLTKPNSYIIYDHAMAELEDSNIAFTTIVYFSFPYTKQHRPTLIT